MHCTNCNQEISDQAVVCPHCGVQVNTARNFCRNCGSQLPPQAAVCVNCGVPVQGAGTGAKSKMAAGLLGIFLGVFGVHNFYLGYTSKAVAQLLLGTLGACLAVGPVVSGIWGLVEGIMILTGSINKDAQGNFLTE